MTRLKSNTFPTLFIIYRVSKIVRKTPHKGVERVKTKIKVLYHFTKYALIIKLLIKLREPITCTH